MSDIHETSYQRFLMRRILNLVSVGVICLLTALLVLGSGNPRQRAESSWEAQIGELDSLKLAAVAKEPEKKTSDSVEFLHPVIVRKPTGPPRIELAGADPQGRSGSVACSTCHAIRKPNLTNVSSATLDEFHQGMNFSHGRIACYACHHPDNSDSLRLADGTSVAYTDVMLLCSQCHGPQATAFAHGAHGGMNGHWDLSRGPQMKNNCIDCHDPHVPNYPKMVVDFKPKDRFNGTPVDHHAHAGADSDGDH